MKTSELLAKVDMQPVSRAKNLGKIGWADGYMVVQFCGRPQLYIFGSSIPEAEFDKIKANPFPDRLFTTNIKNKYQCHKVGATQ